MMKADIEENKTSLSAFFIYHILTSNLSIQKELLSCTDVRKMNFGYYDGGYYIEWFFTENNKYRLVTTVNDISLTYWNGLVWQTKWKK